MAVLAKDLLNSEDLLVFSFSFPPQCITYARVRGKRRVCQSNSVRPSETGSHQKDTHSAQDSRSGVQQQFRHPCALPRLRRGGSPGHSLRKRSRVGSQEDGGKDPGGR
ncbi:hypothetical protein TNCV_1965611 [Trichonephila clavipes]|nr:hypothetical protein TNCV_1965611 [Trichonephila clavipes]